MRTTTNLPEALVEKAKAKAAAEHRSLASIVEEGPRRVLGHEEEAPGQPLPAYGSPNGRFLVDITDRDALCAALDTD